jgi:benzaldehyde dehydrogenase (NAD)
VEGPDLRRRLALAACAERLPVGDPTRNDVAMGPIIDERQRDNIHRVVTASGDDGATQYAS